MLLLDWKLYEYLVLGFVVDHPKLGCSPATSSMISGLEYFEDHLHLYTISGSEYILNFDRANLEKKSTSITSMKRMGIPVSVVKKFEDTGAYTPSIKLEAGDMYIEFAGMILYACIKGKDRKQEEVSLTDFTQIDNNLCKVIQSEDEEMQFVYRLNSLNGFVILSNKNISRIIFNNLSISDTPSVHFSSGYSKILSKGLTYIDCKQFGGGVENAGKQE